MKVQHETQPFEMCIQSQFSGKFLGFMVTQTGMEANPIQLKAIMDSQIPQENECSN